MIKIYTKNKACLLLILLLAISCDSFLDKNPDNRQDLSSLDNIAALLVSAYSDGTYNFIEWRTENAVPNRKLEPSMWQTENYTFKPIVSSEDQDTPTYLWNANYYAIAHANQALEALDKIKSKDKKRKDALRGEALISRAYNHFILASVFCQAYDKLEASNVLGIPYLTAPEKKLIVTYERGTLEQTYNAIEKDLLEGLPLIDDKYYLGTGKYHFTKAAVYAIASRFFLWKGDYDKCIAYSNKLLGDKALDDRYCRDYASVFEGSTKAEISNKFIDPMFMGNLLLVRKESLDFIYPYKGYQHTAAVFSDIFGESIHGEKDDLRNNAFGDSSLDSYVSPKYLMLKQYTTGSNFLPYFVMNELRGEEVALNRMEAYVKTGRIADALQDYNNYAKFCYKGYEEIALDDVEQYYSKTAEESMMQLLIDERRREFLSEGMRWWDIKRYKLTVTHQDIYGNLYELKADDLRKAVQLPAKVIANGIEANPM